MSADRRTKTKARSDEEMQEPEAHQEIVIALVALPLVSRSLGGVGRAPSIELLSRVLLVAVALWLLLRAWRGHKHDGRRHCGP
jgi:ABC-type nickel/cobalt efflux system permease component RcnA